MNELNALKQALSAVPARPLDDDPIAGLPDNAALLMARLRRIQADTEGRAGREFMGNVRESSFEFITGGDGLGPWRD